MIPSRSGVNKEPSLAGCSGRAYSEPPTTKQDEQETDDSNNRRGEGIMAGGSATYTSPLTPTAARPITSDVGASGDGGGLSFAGSNREQGLTREQ